jgi:hypothetical protein
MKTIEQFEELVSRLVETSNATDTAWQTYLELQDNKSSRAVGTASRNFINARSALMTAIKELLPKSG